MLAFRFRPLGRALEKPSFLMLQGDATGTCCELRQVLDCASPLALWRWKRKKGTSASSAASAFPVSVIKDSFGTSILIPHLSPYRDVPINRLEFGIRVTVIRVKNPDVDDIFADRQGLDESASNFLEIPVPGLRHPVRRFGGKTIRGGENMFWGKGRSAGFQEAPGANKNRGWRSGSSCRAATTPPVCSGRPVGCGSEGLETIIAPLAAALLVAARPVLEFGHFLLDSRPRMT
jgi:hypothetical protein